MSIRRSLSSQRRSSSLMVKKKQTAETNDLEETSPSELHLAPHSKLEINEWIEQESKIVSD